MLYFAFLLHGLILRFGGVYHSATYQERGNGRQKVLDTFNIWKHSTLDTSAWNRIVRNNFHSKLRCHCFPFHWWETWCHSYSQFTLAAQSPHPNPIFWTFSFPLMFWNIMPHRGSFSIRWIHFAKCSQSGSVSSVLNYFDTLRNLLDVRPSGVIFF